MSIARAFTTRRARQHTLESKDRDPNAPSTAGNIASSVDNFLHRSKTTKAFTTHGSIRNKISSPVELTHTTNMLSYNAPSIFPGEEQTISIKAALPTAAAAGMMAAAASPAMTPSPSSSSLSAGIKSDDEVSESGETNASTPPTSPDTPFPRDDDKRAEPNHLSCYFMVPKPTDQASGLGINASATTTTPTEAAKLNRSSSLSSMASPSPFAAAAPPVIPQRAPSHTKKSYESIGRHRSVQSSRSLSSKGSFSFSRSSSSSTSTSVSSSVSQQHHQSMKPVISAPLAVSSSAPLADSVPVFAQKKEFAEAHPFGQELAKVSELVEEFKDEMIVEEEDVEEAPSANPLYVEEERALVQLGLKKYSAESYISDIQSLMGSFFAVDRPVAVWI